MAWFDEDLVRSLVFTKTSVQKVDSLTAALLPLSASSVTGTTYVFAACLERLHSVADCFDPTLRSKTCHLPGQVLGRVSHLTFCCGSVPVHRARWVAIRPRLTLMIPVTLTLLHQTRRQRCQDVPLATLSASFFFVSFTSFLPPLRFARLHTYVKTDA